MNYSNLKALLRRRFHIPKDRDIRKTINSFTIAEKTVFYSFVGIFIFSGLTLLWRVNESFLVEVPIRGGSLTEGVVGNPRFINPVLAISEADKNLESLVYSGLMKSTPSGEIVNDLAENVSIEENGLKYVVKLKDDAVFHDGRPVTADDVIFTIQKISDPIIKSPRRGNWEGVTTEKIDELTVSFTLKKAYAPFIENLTVGILPKHIWKNVTDDEFAFSQFNTFPVGSGPFMVNKVERNSGGIPNYYALIPFESTEQGAPYLRKLIFKFFPNELSLFDAYDKGEIESVGGVSPEKAVSIRNQGNRVISYPLPRVFAVFFNQSQSKVLALKEVRQALDLATPKESIVEDVLGGYAVPIDGPLPPGIFEWSSTRSSEKSYEERLKEAEELLAANGWKRNDLGILEKKSGNSTIELSFSISTGDAPELKAVATKLLEAWQKLGARVEILVFETGDLNHNVIRPRKFDALLFGTVVGRDADVYPFWHSSQRNDPGLNIALYANSRVDKLLEEARITSDKTLREAKYKEFDQVLRTDLPAVFLYSPSFIYVMPEKVHAITLGGISTSQDRFSSINNWYIETDKIWEIFNRKPKN